MARLLRLVVSGLAHHVAQRGNRRGPTFFEDGDDALYRDLLGEAARKAEVEICAYCLMPNHVHLIIVPAEEDGLRRTLAETHRRGQMARSAGDGNRPVAETTETWAEDEIGRQEIGHLVNCPRNRNPNCPRNPSWNFDRGRYSSPVTAQQKRAK